MWFSLVRLFLFIDITLAIPNHFTIGGVLSSKENEEIFKEAVDELNQYSDSIIEGVVYNSTSHVMAKNIIAAAMALCGDMFPEGVYVVVASHAPEQFDEPPISISYTCGFYHIPVVGITARDSILSDKLLHNTYIRTVPPYSNQGIVWIEIVRKFKWKKVIIISSEDTEGRAITASFRNEIRIREPIAVKAVDYSTLKDDYTDVLEKVAEDGTTVFLLSASKRDAEVLFDNAQKMNMTQSGYVWIINEKAMEANNVPFGTLGVSLEHGANEGFHIKDIVKIVGKALKKLYLKGGLTSPPTNCHDGSKWKNGQTLMDLIMEETLDNGLTGYVSFNHWGDRAEPVYTILNVRENNQKVVVGHYGKHTVYYSGLLLMNGKSIVWPGNRLDVPGGVTFPKHMRAVTIDSIPFVFTRDVNSRLECKIADKEIYCPQPSANNTDSKRHFCCYGYCVDMLLEMSAAENFTFELYLVPDGKFGTLQRVNYTSTYRWNGVMGELTNGYADMIVAPMTITPDRANDIEFTTPFKFQGILTLVKKGRKKSNLDSFLQPFKATLWILVVVSVHVIALVLYILDKLSPFSRFIISKDDDIQEDSLNLPSAMWFAWGVLLNSGISEGTPRSFSARVLGMVWAGFTMIIVASYTANLAAFLVLDRPEAPITGIEDPRLRNPQADFTFSTVKNSAVLEYFKRKVDLSSMYRTMEGNLYDQPEEAINDVLKGALGAFLWDSTRLEYESAHSCDLITVGDLFGRSGYAIGLPKNSPWVHRMSVKLLQMHEVGIMEMLDTKWILDEKECKEHGSSPATLGLTNMAGVFMLVAGGIVAGIILILIEITYKKRLDAKNRKMEIARNAAQRWRQNIERRKFRRDMRAMLRKEIEKKPISLNDGEGKPFNQVEEISLPERLAADKHSSPEEITTKNDVPFQDPIDDIQKQMHDNLTATTVVHV